MANRIKQTRKNAGGILYKARPFEQVVMKLEKESEAQYGVFKLYCKTGSLVKLRSGLEALSTDKQTPLFTRRGGLPYRRTLDRWCRKFRWVIRKEKWTREQCKETYSWFTDQRRNNPSFLMAVKPDRGYTKYIPDNGGKNSPNVPQRFSKIDGGVAVSLRQDDGKNGTNSGQNEDEIKGEQG
jgi:hypothetical protein